MIPVRLSNASRPSAPWEIRRREILSPPPERVWKALTEPSQLQQWWCDHAEVDCRVGGKYFFSGPGVFGASHSAATASDAAIISCREPELLEFAWSVRGVATRVRYELTSHLAQTDLTVIQSGPQAPPWPASSGEPSWWWVILPALRGHVEEGKARLRPDYAALSSAATIRLEVDVSTFPWIIWNKLTDPKQLVRWWARSPRVDLEPPGTFVLEGNYLFPGENSCGPRRILEAAPGVRLRHDWRWPRGTTGEVEWEIEAREGEDTRLGVTDHGPWDADADRDQLVVLWASTLLYLQQISEKGITPREYQDG